MTIKDVEERTGLSRSNVRFYEKEKLVEPSRSESQCCSDLLGQSDHFRIRHRALLLDVIAERFPLDQLHYYVVDVSFPTYIIDIYDIRMGQARRRL